MHVEQLDGEVNCHSHAPCHHFLARDFFFSLPISPFGIVNSELKKILYEGATFPAVVVVS